MKKTINIFIIISVFMLSTLNTSVKAEECTFYPAISHIRELEKGPILILNGEKNNTYWQFEDIKQSFSIIKKVENTLLCNLAKLYKLEDLNLNNWSHYKNALEYEIYVNNIVENMHTNRLLDFFDVCDNQEKNILIKNLYDSGNYSMVEMAILLPYTSPYYIEYSNTPQISTYSNFNISKAISYAAKYAETYNYSYQVWLNADCTNFASQIVRAGGIENKGSASSGWYYGGVGNNSDAWRLADNFVKYWKVDYSTINFNTFSNKISKGKFIAYDSNSDGKWNHVAFVTDTKSGTTTSGYKDFKVAQHTKNYHAWVSSTTNGWENVSGIKAIIKTPS